MAWPPAVANTNVRSVFPSREGKAYRLMYRFRRAYWYVRRGGLGYAIKQTGAWRARLRDMLGFSRAK